MVWCFRGSKGGSGCSVVAAAAAVLSARRVPVLLVDAAGGDLSRILGVDPRGPGLTRWLRHPKPPPDSLARLEVPATEGVSLLPYQDPGPEGDLTRASEGRPGSPDSPGDDVDANERWQLLAQLLAADERLVVVDLGLASPVSGSAFRAISGVAERSTLVTRLCYLALARAMEQPVPDDVIVVAEPDRALRLNDVEAALRVPVTTIRWDPAVARAVDSGLLTRRLPRALHRIPTAGALS